jgi:hypothetical protein
MEAMLGISVSQTLSQTSKNAIFLIITYVFSSTKLDMKAEQVLPGSKEDGGRGRGQEAGGEMAQTMYAHMNK